MNLEHDDNCTTFASVAAYAVHRLFLILIDLAKHIGSSQLFKRRRCISAMYQPGETQAKRVYIVLKIAYMI